MTFQILGFVFVSVFGTLSHFLYDWTNHSKIGSILFAVNESTWEHIKIALTPTFFWTIIEIPYYHHNVNFIVAILFEVLTIVVIIPFIFYGYKVITKKPVLFIDISTFFVAVFLSQYMFYHIINLNPFNDLIVYITLILLIILFSSYLLLTIYPLKNLLFKDPLTNKYGIEAHK